MESLYYRYSFFLSNVSNKLQALILSVIKCSPENNNKKKLIYRTKYKYTLLEQTQEK